MHRVYNCHHIKSCQTIHYDASQYRVYIPEGLIPKLQWQGPRCVLFYALTAVYSILPSVLLRVPPLKFPSLPISLPPMLLPFSSLSRSVAPSFLCSLSPSPLSFTPSMPTFLPHSFPSSTFPPFLHSRSHPPSHHRFLTPSRCSLPTLPLLPPSHPRSCLAPSMPPSLPDRYGGTKGLQLKSRRPIQCTPCVVFGQMHWVYCVAPSQAWQWDNGGASPVAGVLSIAICYIQGTYSHHKSIFWRIVKK